MSETSSKPDTFRRVDVSDASRLLKEAVKARAPAYVWTKNHKHAFTTPIIALSTSTLTLYTEPPPEFDAGKFSDELLKKSADADCFFNISLARANLFFKSHLKGYDTGGLRFQLPDEIFKVQRREAVRVVIPSNLSLIFSFRDPLFAENRLEKKVMDLSANGMAFLAPEREKQVFSAGTILEEAELRLKDRIVQLEAEVRHARAVPEPTKSKAIKIGLEFRKLRPGDAQFIASFVFELSRRAYAKFA